MYDEVLIVLQFVVLIICIYLSGRFSGAETAITSLTVLDIIEMKTEKHPRADLLFRLKKDIDKVIVTSGWRGCTLYSGGELLNIPAFTDRVVDKIGAGDALLSVTAPLASIDAPIDIIGFIGNVAGAIAVSYPGNKELIQKEELYKYIKALMK